MNDLSLFAAAVEAQQDALYNIPATLLAADNHNIGNDGKSWFSPADWYDTVSNIPRFTAVSVLSGANSFYNTGVAIANFFGAEKEYNDAFEWVSELDSDLGQYYKENKQAADLVGFIGSSLIPGLAGVKVLSAGQKALLAAKETGRIGSTLGKAVGLLNPSVDYWTAQSVRQIATAQTTFSSINANTIRAIASGFGDAALQSAAFETAVAATMFKSPVLEDMEIDDIVKNIALGTVLGAGIGGVFSAAKTFGTIKKTVSAVDEIEKAYTFTPELSAGVSPSDRIVTWLEALKNTPEPEIGAALATKKLGQDSAMQDFVKRFTQQAATRNNSIWNAVRTQLGEMAGGDQILTESMYNALRGMDSDQVMKNILGSVQVGRVNDILKLSKEIARDESVSLQAVDDISSSLQRLIKRNTAVKQSTAVAFESEELEKLSPKGLIRRLERFKKIYRGDEQDEIVRNIDEAISSINRGKLVDATGFIDNVYELRMAAEAKQLKSIMYVKLWGDDAGKVVGEKPRVIGISDTEKDLDGFIRKQLFSVKESIGLDTLLSNPLKVEARYIWARSVTGEILPDVIKATDFPLLERAYELGKRVKIQAFSGEVFEAEGRLLFSHIAQTKEEIAANLLRERLHVKNLLSGNISDAQARSLQKRLREALNSDDIAKLLNVRRTYLEGAVSDDVTRDLFAYQSYQKEYQADLIAKGLWKEERGQYDLYKLPQWAQIGYKQDIIKENGDFLRGLAYLKAKEKLHMQQVNHVLAAPSQFGAFFDQFFDIPEQAILGANRFGAGSGLFSFANGNYGSLASMMESIGASTNALKNNLRDIARGTIEPSLIKLKGNSEAALELQAIFQRLASTAENYVLMPDGMLRPQRLVEWETAVRAGRNIEFKPVQEGAPLQIQIANPETLEVIRNHVQRNGERLLAQQERRAVQGLEQSLRHDVVYVPKPDPRDYNHFFFVVDETVTAEASGRVRMVHAATAKDLEALKNRIPSEYKIVTKGETEEYYKAIGQYDYERTLHNSNIDINLKRRGVNSQFLPKTDPQQIADDLMNWHLRQEDIAARDMVSMRYEKEFAELEKLGEQYTGIALSRYAYDRKFAENIVKNPYVNYIKTALDISKIQEYPMLSAANRMIDRAFSEAARAVGGAWNKTYTVDDLNAVNSAMERYGLKTAYDSVESLIAANHTAPRGALSKFVREANAVLATTILRWDPLNAINNAVGSQVMLGAETRSLLKAIEANDSAAAGKLAELMSTPIPGSTVQLKSAGKMIAKAHADYISAVQNPALLDEFKRLGYVTDLTNQYHRMLDELTLRGSENVTDLNARMGRAFAAAKKLGDLGEKWTGNSHAEEMNRFVAAHVMKQITDVAEQVGVISADEAITYIRTFVNRTQGNILASQRPLVFQGPIGQAVGLFQTYQFNLLQQLLRYVGEGSAKDAAMLLGLQGTIYGLNGLPGFSFINQHIIGTASGNTQHRDLYTATYGVFGNTAADFLMYGIPSNVLGANLYTRGDINPRHPTIIPVNPLDIPIVSVFGKFIGSMQESFSKVANGGAVWESVLQGIEHSGINRPLAGLSQVLRGVDGGPVYSTSTRGNILGANDLFSYSSLIRLSGGKPFDEARLIDAMHRFLGYAAYDRRKRLALGEAFKTVTIDGEMPNPQQIENFAKAYTERGGDGRNFNKWMMEQVKNAKESQVNRIAENLKSPTSQQMQLLMGSEPYADGRSYQ